MSVILLWTFVPLLGFIVVYLALILPSRMALLNASTITLPTWLVFFYSLVMFPYAIGLMLSPPLSISSTVFLLSYLSGILLSLVSMGNLPYTLTYVSLDVHVTLI